MKVKINDLKLVYLSEFTVRFCTWSILSGLLIHITKAHWVDMPKALYLMGASLSLLYICAILGGFVKDRFFNEKQVIILGIFLIALSNIALSTFNIFYLGLGIFFIGAGMVTPNTPLLLSSLLNNNTDTDKDFTVFYGITNCGIILGPITGGLIEHYFSWTGVIVLNELIISIWLLFAFLSGWVSSLTQIRPYSYLKFFLLILFSSEIIYLSLKFQSFSKCILAFAIASYLLFLTWLMYTFKETRRKIGFSIILTLFAIVFFSGEFQVASSLIAYADNFVRLKESNINIPVTSLVSLESIFVVIGAYIITKTPFFSKIKFLQTKVFIGLVCCSLAFLVLYISTEAARYEKISLLWIIIPSLFLGIGEVSLMPPIISYIAKVSPEKYKGRLISGMYFALSISGYLSGLIGEFIMHHQNFSSNDISFYSAIFVAIALVSIAFALLIPMLRFSRMYSLGASQQI